MRVKLDENKIRWLVKWKEQKIKNKGITLELRFTEALDEIFDDIGDNSPIITSIIADDPDDLDDVYSREDRITITFDSDTNTPGGDKVQRKSTIDDMFTFSESLGRAYSGKWIAPDTFVITIHSVNAASPPIISGTTVSPTGIIPILSADETSEPSTTLSPVLSGDFGIIP